MTPTKQEPSPDYLLKAVQSKIATAQGRDGVEQSQVPSRQIEQAQHGGSVHVAASKEMGV